MTKENGHRVICVGTTCCRTIESAADENGTVEREQRMDQRSLSIRAIGSKCWIALITNFHLPESTLRDAGLRAGRKRACAGGL